MMDDSVLTIIKLYSHMRKRQKLFQQIFMKKKATCKTQNFYVLLAFLLITLALFIALSIFCYLIRYQSKQEHLLLFHVTNNELKETMY